MPQSDLLTIALRRDDLTVRGSTVELYQTVDVPAWRGDYDSDQVDLVFGDDDVTFQALRVVDDIDWEGDAVCLYVPLMHGPVREPEPEAACGLCSVLTPACDLRAVRVFPVRACCEPCAAELLEDDEDARDRPCERCAGGGCSDCLGTAISSGGY
jgi:hypothetical protein